MVNSVQVRLPSYPFGKTEWRNLNSSCTFPTAVLHRRTYLGAATGTTKLGLFLKTGSVHRFEAKRIRRLVKMSYT